MLPKGELWDPGTGEFTALGPPVPSLEAQTATRLPDGRVLLVGGHGHNEYSAGAEDSDPVSESFQPTGSLAHARSWHTSMLLHDGRVLVVGGFDGGDTMVAAAEVWHPQTGLWSDAGSTGDAPEWGSATLLADGRVLLIGATQAGYLGPWDGSRHDGRVTHGAMRAPSATLLNDGRVLVVGGEGPQPPPSPDRCTPRSGGGLRSCTHVDTSLVTAELWTALRPAPVR